MNPQICPTCHAPIPTNAPGGFCPACLLRDAEEPPVNGSAAPTLEEIAAAFPKLEILRLIGHGGMGFVYQARQPELDRMVALKILSPELGRDPAFAERFAREARVLGKLNHPNIVTLFEHGECGGFFYLMMEYIDGVNLRQAMAAGRFTPEQALAIVPAICDALQSAHAQGVWHRDIKPENILLDRDGRVKIADFGIARIIGDPERNFTLTRTGGMLGSAAYMAPEQHEKPHAVDHRADIYSLGVVIYEMLTGELPLGRFPAPSQRAAVNARIDEIVMRTLEKERELRQQSADEVKTDISRAARESISNRVMSGGPLTSIRKSWALRGATMVLVGIIFAGAGYWFLRSREEPVLDEETREIQRLEHLARSSPDLLRKKEIIIEAVKKGWVRPVAFLLDHASSSESDGLALSNAARQGHRSIVELVLARGIDRKGESMAGALIVAIEADNREIVKVLLEAGASPDGKVGDETPKYSTPLVVATRRNYTELARLLIAKGADVNLIPRRCLFGRKSDSTFYIGGPLHEAVWFDRPQMIELLLEHHADVNLAETHSKITPLWLAAWQNSKGNPALVKRLLELGADPDAESAPEPDPYVETWPEYPGKSTPLQRALIAGSVECVKLMLVAKQARGTLIKSILLRDVLLCKFHDDSTAMKMTRLLVEHGADPNPPDVFYEKLIKLWHDGAPMTKPVGKSFLQEFVVKNSRVDPDKIWPVIELLLERGSKVDPDWRSKGFSGAHPEISGRLLQRFPN